MPDTGLILYEFPCSEKIRFYLRLEALKQRLDWFLTLDGKAAHQAAINALFDLSDVAARSDLKNELLKALLQQRRDIEALPANATVDGQPAKTVLALVSEAAKNSCHSRRPFCRLPTRLSSFSTICGRRPSFLMLLPSTGQCRFPHQAVPINSHASGCLRKVNAFLT